MKNGTSSYLVSSMDPVFDSQVHWRLSEPGPVSAPGSQMPSWLSQVCCAFSGRYISVHAMRNFCCSQPTCGSMARLFAGEVSQFSEAAPWKHTVGVGFHHCR